MKLVYVSEDVAYFVPDPETAWGDDWDDAPYEHNAGEPYGDHVAIGYDAPELRRPCDGHYNSPYSVKEINQKKVAWLYAEEDQSDVVRVGASILDFLGLLSRWDGDVILRERRKPAKEVDVDDYPVHEL